MLSVLVVVHGSSGLNPSSRRSLAWSPMPARRHPGPPENTCGYPG